MSSFQFSDLSIQYNLHLEHINHARSHFENESRGLMEELGVMIVKLMENMRQSDFPYIFCQEPEVSGVGRMTVNTSFWVNYSFYILGLKKDSAKRCTGIGRFNSGITYDYDLKTFVWYAKFSNSNKFCSDIDESCYQKIQNSDLPNTHHQKSDEVTFFRYPIDMEINVNRESVLKEALKVLFETIEETGVLKTPEDAGSNENVKRDLSEIEGEE